jgi:transposase
MARYKHIDTSPRLIAVDLQQQLLPGTIEHALHYLFDGQIDLSALDVNYKNDTTGASAYPPSMLLKVILFAYSQGIVSSRNIEAACREHIIFIALSGDTSPHFTTIASFIGTLGEEIAQLFAQVLYICDQQGLIGREMFAIDGVKLPGNAAKAKSGTRAEFIARAAKLEAEVRKMVARHREEDAKAEPAPATKTVQRIERLTHDAQQIRDWLAANPSERQGAKGAIIKSNLTDNESAKMATGKGVIQGYCGVAAVDAKHQIIVEAQAHGTGSEQALLLPIVEAIAPLLVNADKGEESNPGEPQRKQTLITADAGYHSEVNLAALAAMNVDALIADNGMRGRDERFADQGKHKTGPDPLHNKTPKPDGLFRPIDFTFDRAANTCVCPAGKMLHSNGAHCTVNGRTHHKFQGSLTSCGACALRAKCLRHPEKTKTRQVAFFHKNQASPLPHTQAMKERIDSEAGKQRYGRRFATVEPVFGNLRHNKQLNRFTLRGQKKVDTQWKLYAMVHNIEKLAHYGFKAPKEAASSGRKNA